MWAAVSINSEEAPCFVLVVECAWSCLLPACGRQPKWRVNLPIRGPCDTKTKISKGYYRTARRILPYDKIHFQGKRKEVTKITSFSTETTPFSSQKAPSISAAGDLKIQVLRAFSKMSSDPASAISLRRKAAR